MGKYFKYAIGEIILVVAGILIALQINNWNEQQKDDQKEISFLTEIRSNLNQDVEVINTVKQFNEEKVKTIDNVLGIFPDSLSNQERIQILIRSMNVLPNFERFIPKGTAFKNLTSAENISLISSSQIRNLIIEYYERDYVTLQERVWIINRRILDNHLPKFASNAALSYPNDLPSVEELKLHNDPFMYSDLVSLRSVTANQSVLMNDIMAKNEELVKAITEFIGKDNFE